MKKIKHFVFAVLCLMLMKTTVYAASLSVNITSNTVTLGNSITITSKFSSNKAIFFTEGSLKCTGAGVNKTLSLSFDNTTNDVFSKSFSLKIKPTTTGSVKCTTSGTKIIDASSNNWQNIGSKTVTITVKEAPVVKPKEKSSNNYLASLSVEKNKLDKTFDKEVLEYNVTLEPDTEKIKINASLADSSATVAGTGEKSVSPGLNTFEVTVTAENGSKKTYTLKVTVKEHDPINVTIDEEKYTVIRKKKELPKVSEYYEDKKVTIGENEVDGYYNKKLDYTLVGLKDKEGNVELYIYNNDKYSIYKEYTFNGITLIPTEKEVTGDVKKAKFSYDDDKINGYQNVKLDLIKNTYALEDNDIENNNFYLFYAINLDSGKETLYQYDANEKTVQRFNVELLNMYKERSDTYYMYLLGAILIIGVTFLLFMIITISISKKNKKKSKKKKRRDIDFDF